MVVRSSCDSAVGPRSNLSPWRVQTTARVRGVVATPGVRVALGEAAGGVAESQVTILDRTERVCVSLYDRDRAGTPIRSNRRVTKRTTD